MKESELEKQCLCYLEQYTSIAYWKVKAGGQRHTFGGKSFHKKSTMPGFPDMQLIIEGKFVGIEFKTDIGRQSPVQKDCQKYIENAKGLYYIIRNFEDFKNLMSGLIQ